MRALRCDLPGTNCGLGPVRDLRAPGLGPGLPLGPTARHAAAALEALADSASALVVNRPSASATNGSKPYQQQIIRRHGFAVPDTLVTTVPEEARRFYELHRDRVIYKSISGVRSIVTKMTPADLPRLEQVRRCPTQFQRYVPGVDIRVHTVGDRAFATEIRSEATDYRYAGRQGSTVTLRAAELPGDVAERCLRLADALGLVLSGIDLRRTPAVEYCCFEVNTSPAFTFFQAQTGQRIGEAVVDLLCRAPAGGRGRAYA